MKKLVATILVWLITCIPLHGASSENRSSFQINIEREDEGPSPLEKESTANANTVDPSMNVERQDQDSPLLQQEFWGSSSFNVEIPSRPLMVGAYYYPWHKRHFELAEDGYIRRELNPRQEVRLGEYDDTQPQVIRQHLAWSRQANIGLWVTSWWGVNSPEDQTLRQVILPELQPINHKMAILYETMYWLNDVNMNTQNPFQRIQDDVEYLCEHYFDHPNYYKMNGRPVVVIYLTRLLEDRCVLPQVLQSMRMGCPNHSLYLIGDHVWENPPRDSTTLPLMDAVTNYDMFGNMDQPTYATEEGVEDYFRRAEKWKAFAKRYNTALIPSVTPGYNDRGVRIEKDHPALSRRLTPRSPEGSLFEALLERAIPLVDPLADSLLLVNSFNEWHEDTQIEPCDGKTTTEPYFLTLGLEYVGYGTLYLDILARYTKKDDSPPPVQDHLIPVSSRSADMPIQFTGKPYHPGNLAAVYIFPSNFDTGLRSYLNQYAIQPDTPDDLLGYDLLLSWQANIFCWILPWHHPLHPTNDAATQIFDKVENSDHRLIISYHASSRTTLQDIAADVQYLVDNYLTSSNYYQSSTGRPVLLLASTRDLSVGGLVSVIQTIRQVALQNLIDVFLLADHVRSDAPVSDSYFPFSLLDGLMDLEVYGDIVGEDLDGAAAVNDYYEKQRQWRIAAWKAGCSYVPTVLPGYNDRAIRFEESNPILSRWWDGRTTNFFSESLDRAQHLLDSELNNLIVVNSLNNFEEDTQIYPVYGSSAASPYTDLTMYNAYGETYIALLEERYEFAPTMSPPQPPTLSGEQGPDQMLDWCEVEQPPWP